MASAATTILGVCLVGIIAVGILAITFYQPSVSTTINTLSGSVTLAVNTAYLSLTTVGNTMTLGFANPITKLVNFSAGNGIIFIGAPLGNGNWKIYANSSGLMNIATLIGGSYYNNFAFRNDGVLIFHSYDSSIPGGNVVSISGGFTHGFSPDLKFNIGGGYNYMFYANGMEVASLYSTGVLDIYHSISTAGLGVIPTYAEASKTAQTAGVTVTTFTPGSNGVFSIGGDIDISAFTAGTMTLQVSYTDWSGNAQTITLTTATALADYPASTITIMDKGSSAITIATVAGGWTGTYDATGYIGQVA